MAGCAAAFNRPGKRLALAACAKKVMGKAAAGSTQRRKRSVFCNALGHAVEQGHLGSNPVDRIPEPVRFHPRGLPPQHPLVVIDQRQRLLVLAQVDPQHRAAPRHHPPQP
ncbi:MAG: hypothetical protein ACRDOI_34060, partial [Trebonia sp.]